MKKQKRIKTSLIFTTYNEEKSIRGLMDSILNQSVLPDEIVIVDSLSSDKTLEIIKSFNNKRIKIIQKKCNISQGRNIAIKNAKYNYIIATDAGCVLDKDWVKNMISAFDGGKQDYVMGNFKPSRNGTDLQKILGYLSLQNEEKLASDPYFASTRSIGFKKKVWSEIGGFPENLYTGEDTWFNLEAKKRNFRAVFSKYSIVYWSPRESIKKFIKQFYLYGFGDGKSGNVLRIKKRFLAMVAPLAINILMLILLFFPLYFFSAIVLGYAILFVKSSKIIGSLSRKRYSLITPLLIYLKRSAYSVGAVVGLSKYQKGL